MFSFLPWTKVDKTRSLTYDIDDFNEDPCGWSNDIEHFHFGDFSMAAVQANVVMEDYSQVEDGHKATFFGLYDGHRGTEASEYISTHLFPNLLRGFNRGSPVHAMRLAVSETVEEFINVVRRDYLLQPKLGRVGSCCLAGYIYRGRFLYLANLGDSRAVVGCQNKPDKIIAEQLTTNYNGRNAAIRDELTNLRHDDLHIVLQNCGAWLFNGINKFIKSIRDAYLKKLTLTHVDFPKFEKVLEPFRRPVVSSTPEAFYRYLRDEDKFLIIASHGLWEILSNEEATNIVHRNIRYGIAKRLIRSALVKAAKKKNISYETLQNHNNRREFHDDITVIVIFLDRGIPLTAMEREEASFKSFTDMITLSDFTTFNHDPIMN